MLKLVAAAALGLAAAQTAQPISFWPIPTGLSFGAGNVVVDPSVAITVNPPVQAVTDYAGWLRTFIFANPIGGPVPSGAITSIAITVANPQAPMAIGMDESYSLAVTANGITIAANTTNGAYMALQTLSQAIRFSFDTQQYGVAGVPLMITDAPKFKWRGLLIDTDRHWLSLHHIFRIIESLAFSKMNILHWHIVDWQSWPLQSVAYPKLWSAAWSARERYTFADVKAVINFAASKGIIVVPEFDTPGHATSMCVGYPELCCSAACGPASNYPLSPVPDANGQNVTLNAIQAVLQEMVALSPGEFFHLGGDEVDQTCWQNTPAVQAWMKTQGFTTTDQVYEYFVATVDAMAIGLNRAPIRWEEVWKHFGTDLDKRTVIHAWLSSQALIDATNAGYRAIWSVDGKYYLDALSETWKSFYDVDILAGITNTSAIPLVLGGETEMWGETADGSDVLQTIWPRAAAAAERQWSYNVVTNSSAPGVSDRLQAFRCLLLERGIPAAPVTNPTARQAPGGPGSCMTQ